MILEAVLHVNENLPPSGRVKKFVLLHKEFDADEAEMTRTRKLRRGFLTDRYGDMIDALYSDKDAIKVSALIQYQDGREGIVETDVHIMTIEEDEKA